MTINLTSRLTRAAAVSVLCAATFSGLATAPAQALSPEMCDEPPITKYFPDSGICLISGPTRESEDATFADQKGLEDACIRLGGDITDSRHQVVVGEGWNWAVNCK
jgi:hypothetical protein